MSDTSLVRRQVVDTFFVHNSFGSFYSGVLNWFADELYPRFQYRLVGTYEKAVQFFKDRQTHGIDLNEKILPSITLDPMLDFSQEERGGRFLWQHSTYAPGIGMRLFKGIDLKEQDILLTPVFSRYQGTFEITFWLSSVYELIDFRVALLQFCGGYQRWLRPEFFWSYLILPDEIEHYEKEDGTEIDWGNSYADLLHVDTINKHKLAVPIPLDPIWRLESLGDSSTKYGGDQLTEYKMSGTFGYEINIPTYIVLSRGLDPRLKLTFSIGKTYSKYPLVSPFKILKFLDDEQQVKDKYLEDDYVLFTFQDYTLSRQKLICEFSSNTVVYPTKIPYWNYIVSGRLIHLTEELIASDIRVEKDDIVYFDYYIPSFLPAIRRSLGVISFNDARSSDLYHKCMALKKSFVGSLSHEEQSLVQEYENQIVTLDTMNRSLYNGILTVVVADSDNPVAGYQTIEFIKDDFPELYEKAVHMAQEQEPINKISGVLGGPVYSDELQKRLVYDKCNGIQTRFFLGFTLTDNQEEKLLIYENDELKRKGTDYTLINNDTLVFSSPPEKDSTIYIGGHFMIFRDSRLIVIYEFTEEDLTRTDSIIIELSEAVEKPEDDIVLVSYMGRMEYEKDYLVGSDNKTITILISPLKDEIIEIFQYV